MSTYATTDTQEDAFGSGIAGAVVLHLAVAGVIVGAALFSNLHSDKWGEDGSSVGAIQASMVSAIPLPTRATAVDKSVLTPDDISKAAEQPPKVATQPPPAPNTIEIKAKTTPTKVAPASAPVPPKHAQPTPDTPKANTGQQATQLPQSVTQLKNGTASITVQDRTFGDRYAYYIQIVGRMTNQSWNEEAIDPRATHNKSVSVLFDIQRDGTIANIHIASSSGVPTIDTAALRAIQRIDTFGPLPAGDRKTIEYKFDYN